MILGNQNWQTGLAQQQKQPLYLLTIPGFGIYLASFTANAGVSIGGYGVSQYGVKGYGT